MTSSETALLSGSHEMGTPTLLRSRPTELPSACVLIDGPAAGDPGGEGSHSGQGCASPRSRTSARASHWFPWQWVDGWAVLWVPDPRQDQRVWALLGQCASVLHVHVSQHWGSVCLNSSEERVFVQKRDL